MVSHLLHCSGAIGIVRDAFDRERKGGKDEASSLDTRDHVALRRESGLTIRMRLCVVISMRGI